VEPRIGSAPHFNIYCAQVGPAESLAAVALGLEAPGPEVRDMTAHNGGRLASKAVSPATR